MRDVPALSEKVRDELGLAGWPIPWETRRERMGNLHFGLSRPGGACSTSLDSPRRSASPTLATGVEVDKTIYSCSNK